MVAGLLHIYILHGKKIKHMKRDAQVTT